MRFLVIFAATALLAGCNYRYPKNQARPTQPQAGGNQVTYEQVRAQILAPLCLECHNPDLAKAGLDLSTREASQAAITPGNPAESLLYNMVEWDEMPPKRRIPPLRLLTPEEKAMVRDWINGGAR